MTAPKKPRGPKPDAKRKLLAYISRPRKKPLEMGSMVELAERARLPLRTMQYALRQLQDEDVVRVVREPSIYPGWKSSRAFRLEVV